MDTKAALEYSLNQLDQLDMNVPVTINAATTITSTLLLTGSSMGIYNLPQYADKATAEAALSPNTVYINTTTGALSVALA